MGVCSKIRAISIISTFLFFISAVGIAQTVNEAREAFNNGVTAQGSGNLEEAIGYFNECLDLCYELEGEEGIESLQIQVESMLPKFHLELGKSYYKEKQTDKAIEEFERSAQIASMYGDEVTESQAKRLIPQLYVQKGIQAYKAENFEGALVEFTKAVNNNPDYPSGYYYKALAQRQLQMDDALTETLDKGIEVSASANDNKNLERIRKVGRDYYLKTGVSEKEAGNYDNAVKYLLQSINYEKENATTHYILATVYNEQSQWDNAVASAEKALEYESDQHNEEAKIYYELGKAYKEKGDKSAACDAFKKSAVGPYEEAAKYEIEHVLKCD